MNVAKYICPKCHAIVEVPHSSSEKNVRCEECKTNFRILPSKKKKKWSLNEKRKMCLWIGVAAIDLAGAYVLAGRNTLGAFDGFFLITLIAITTGVVFYSYSLEGDNPHKLFWRWFTGKDWSEVEPYEQNKKPKDE